MNGGVGLPGCISSITLDWLASSNSTLLRVTQFADPSENSVIRENSV